MLPRTFLSVFNSGKFLIRGNMNGARALYYAAGGRLELPRKLRKSERNPWVTPVNELKRKARMEKQSRRMVEESILRPPENGLLVKELIPVAHNVLWARDELFNCISKVSQHIPIHFCSVCGEVHVGYPPHRIRTCNVSANQRNKEHTWERGGIYHVLPLVESFHLYDRIGRAVSHNERLQVDRIPAILELCIQAGMDIPEYPTRRRKFPVYSVAGKMIDFEKKFPKNEMPDSDRAEFGFWESMTKPITHKDLVNLPHNDIKVFAEQGMDAWELMRTGATKLMRKYAVQTCRYCSEVQVGPGGHRVRQCQSFKHQTRDGQHFWVEATVDDIVPPVYVWHVQDGNGGLLLVDPLRKYYGKLPAVVELFARAGAKVGGNYNATMRKDVMVPDLEEEKLVV